MSADQFLSSAGPAGAQGRRPLVPFAPPEDFDHGKEFAAAPPRPLPDFVGHSRYVIARKGEVWILILIGLFCFTMNRLPFVGALNCYFWIFDYLDWIGWTCLAVAVCGWARNFVMPGRLTLLRRGEPLIGLIRNVELKVSRFSEPPTGRFVAEVEYRESSSGAAQFAIVKSPETFHVYEQETLHPGIASGDYVTLVRLADRPKTTLQLYGWLGLNPACDLIRMNGYPLQPISPLVALVVFAGVTAFIWIMLGFANVIGAYSVLDGDCHWKTYVAGVGLATIPFAIVLKRYAARDRTTKSTLIKGCLLAGFFSLCGGMLVGFTLVGFVNGFFDRSPPHLEPVRIQRILEKTRSGLLREYELEYCLLPGAKNETKLVGRDTQSLFAPGGLGAIDIGSGWLGMRWIRGFHAVEWLVLNEGQAAPGEIKYQLPDEPAPTRIAPFVVIGDNPPVSPPALLLPELRGQMATALVNSHQATLLEEAER